MTGHATPTTMASTSSHAGPSVVPIAEPRTQPSPHKRKALSPPDHPAESNALSLNSPFVAPSSCNTSTATTTPAGATSSPYSPSSLPKTSLSQPQAPLASTSAATPFRRHKPTEEERRQRREARQARNRQSAQNSRERKKIYVEQLETTAAALREDNTRLVQQLQLEHQAKSELQCQLDYTQGRVHALEALIRQLLKASGHTHLPSILAAMASIVKAPLSAATSPVKSLPCEGPCVAPRIGSATIAAPVPTASTQDPTATPSTSLGDLDTCLPAAEVSCLNTASLNRETQCEQPQQRVSYQHLRASMAAVPGPGVWSGPMAAASSAAPFPRSATPASPSLVKALPANSRSSSRSAPPRPSQPLARIKVRWTPSTSTSSLTCNSSAPSTSVVTRRLRIRVRIPRRLPKRLAYRCLARSLVQRPLRIVA
ncbi:hypothetical protein ACQY0O_007371 [Thecaphora frezii]